MSYQPEPERDPKHYRLGRLYIRLAAWAKLYPLAFWFRSWLFFAGYTGIFLFTSGLDTFDRPGRKLILLFAILGWIGPFTMWIRKNRRLNK